MQGRTCIFFAQAFSLFRRAFRWALARDSIFFSTSFSLSSTCAAEMRSIARLISTDRARSSVELQVRR